MRKERSKTPHARVRVHTIRYNKLIIAMETLLKRHHRGQISAKKQSLDSLQVVADTVPSRYV